MPDLSWLSVRPSFELAVMFVTWLAILILTLIVVALNYRIQVLERAARLQAPGVAYASLIGRPAWTPERARSVGFTPETVLLLSSDCRSCESIVNELRYASGLRPTAVAWKDAGMAGLTLPPVIGVVPDGETLSRELGVGVTPFALKLNPDGNIVAAMPIASLGMLSDIGQSRTAAAM